jgi:hypothetical protein
MNFPSKNIVYGIYETYIKANKAHNWVLDILQKEINTVVNSFCYVHFPEIRDVFLSDIHGGCKAEGWEPTIHVFLDDIYENSPENTVVRDLYSLRKIHTLVDTYLIPRLPDYVKVKFSYKHVPEGIRCEDDIVPVLGDHVKLVVTGTTYYKGWDIPDVYFIVHDSIQNKYRMFVSKDGHGGYAEEEFDVDVFFGLIEQDSDNNDVRPGWYSVLKEQQTNDAC